jgi:hypothetical protein
VSEARRKWILLLAGTLVAVCAIGAYHSWSRFVRDRTEASTTPPDRRNLFNTEESRREQVARTASLATGFLGYALGFLMVALRRGFVYRQPGLYCFVMWMLIMAIRSLIQRDWLWGGVALAGVVVFVLDDLLKRGPPVPRKQPAAP